MEKLKVAKVDSVLLQDKSNCRRGTLHLTQHHLIFAPDAEAPVTPQHASTSSNKDEVWFPYSLFWLVTRLPSILPLENNSTPASRSSARRIFPLLLRLRNFENAALGFSSDTSQTDVFESIKASIIATTADDLYAHCYQPRPPLPLAPQGWHLYDAKAEFKRQGVGIRTKAWRFCDVNCGYGFCSTYPSNLCVPSRISDTVIRHAAKYRSKERIPALTYLHRLNLASISRSSQPLVGLNNRSMQDERLIEAIFTSHLFADPESPTAKAALAAGMNSAPSGHAATDRGNIIAIYGATTTNLIVDARPTTNAMANRAKGAGTENMEHYKGCKKVYLGVDNIHVMRDSLQKVANALRAAEAPWTFGFGKAAAAAAAAPSESLAETDASEQRPISVLSERDAAPLDHVSLKRSAWLKHIAALLEGTVIITKNVHVNNSHVLIHCSDGWDRTSQLSALAQLCLDPYYRTIQGFAVLVEKDWCSFGHRFWDRCGHASSEKYFQTAQGYGEENSEDESGEEASAGGGFEPQAAANAIWGFTKQFTANFQSSGEGHSSHGRGGAHLKEISPVFHQFLDCIWQIMRQYPARFEFNEKWLLDLYDGLYECKYGTFLYNSEGERNGLSEVGKKPAASIKTTSIWDYMLDGTRRERYLNPGYQADLDGDAKRTGADLGVLMPNSKDVGFWGGLFRRDGNDMNRLVQAEAEERRRLLEAEQKQYAAIEVESSPGPSEVQGITVGPVIRNAEEDPVLRNGVVDLGKASLTYQPYQPRSKKVSRPVAQSEGPLSVSPTPPAASQEAEEDGLASNVQDTTAKVKTLFMGWGAKLQDAYNGATAGGEEQQHRTSDDRHAIHKSAATHGTPLPVERREPRYQNSKASMPARNTPAYESESNPWAAPSRKENDFSLEATPAYVAGERARTLPSVSRAQAPAPPKKEDVGKGGKQAAFDPLGVGAV